jgi:hypothetical protein
MREALVTRFLTLRTTDHSSELRDFDDLVTHSTFETVTNHTKSGAIPLPSSDESLSKIRHCSQRGKSFGGSSSSHLNPGYWIRIPSVDSRAVRACHCPPARGGPRGCPRGAAGRTHQDDPGARRRASAGSHSRPPRRLRPSEKAPRFRNAISRSPARSSRGRLWA